MISKFWGWAIIALPLFLRRSDVLLSPRTSRDLFLYMVTCLGIALFGIKKPNKELSIIIGTIIAYAFFNQFMWWNNYTNFNYQMLSIGLLLLIHFHGMSLKFFESLKKYIAIAGIMQSAMVTLNYFGVDFYSTIVRFVLQVGTVKSANYNLQGLGSLFHNNLSSSFIAITIPFMGKFIPIGLLGLSLTGSMGGLSSFLLGTALLLFIRIKKIRPYSLAGGLFGVLALYKIDGFKTLINRLDAWSQGMEWSEPWFGLGLSWVPLSGQIISGDEIFRQMHNEYMDIYVAFGTVGLSLFLLPFWIKRKAVLECDNVYLWSALIVIINSLVHFTFHISATALIGTVVFARILKERENDFILERKSNY